MKSFIDYLNEAEAKTKTKSKINIGPDLDAPQHDQSGPTTNTLGLMTTGNLGTSATLIGRVTYISAS